jgi:hypothetical protein
MRAASAEDLAQSPVLFLSGRGALTLSLDQREQLERYVFQGGFLFVEACQGYGCDGAAFEPFVPPVAGGAVPGQQAAAVAAGPSGVVR